MRSVATGDVKTFSAPGILGSMGWTQHGFICLKENDGRNISDKNDWSASAFRSAPSARCSVHLHCFNLSLIRFTERFVIPLRHSVNAVISALHSPGRNRLCQWRDITLSLLSATGATNEHLIFFFIARSFAVVYCFFFFLFILCAVWCGDHASAIQFGSRGFRKRRSDRSRAMSHRLTDVQHCDR